MDNYSKGKVAKQFNFSQFSARGHCLAFVIKQNSNPMFRIQPILAFVFFPSFITYGRWTELIDPQRVTSNS